MIIEWLARLWAINDPLPDQVDLLVCVSHGATVNRPTNGAMSVSRKTKLLQKSFGQKYIPVGFGAFTGSPNPEIEKVFRMDMFRSESMYVGTVLSTIEECLKIRKHFHDGWFGNKKIVVVTDEAHSRRCKMVWKTLCPKAKIYVVSVPISETKDLESPMWPYRSMWTTLLFQAGPTLYFWYLKQRGANHMAKQATKLHQPIV